jgi:hypothetical protein
MRYAILLVVACAGARPLPAPGPELGNDKRVAVTRIELCRTTAAQLASVFGPPTNDGRLGPYTLRAWVLDTYKVGDTTLPRVLIVLIDGKGTVVDLSWDAPIFGVAWSPRYQCS